MEIDVEALIDLLDSKLIFSTSDGHFEGILKLIMVKKQRVTFEHTYFLPSRKYMGTVQIQFSDLLSYKLLKGSDTILDASKFHSVGELVSGDLEKKLRIDDSLAKDASIDFYDELPAHLKHLCPYDYCLIESDNSVFSRAINHILGCNVIGVSFHGSELSRHGSLSWVCVATKQCVFMFDIDSMGIAAFHGGLRKIFEDDNIEKIVHDCREPADCLKHLFQTTLNNVFDSQVADYLVNMQRYDGEVIFKHVNCLDSCLVKYLKVPQQLLYNRNKCVSKDSEIQFYKMRPVSDEFKNILIKSVLYFHALREELEKLLLHPFHQAVDIYLNVLREATEAEIFKVPNEFTQTAPRYLSESIKIVRFYDIPIPPDDTICQFRQTSHGEETRHRKLIMKQHADSSTE